MNNSSNNLRIESGGKKHSPQKMRKIDIHVNSKKIKRKKRKKVLLRLFQIFFTLFLIYTLGQGTYRFIKNSFIDNEDLKLKEIIYYTNGKLKKDEVLNHLKIKEGIPFFKLNLGDLKEKLEKFPQILNVNISRELPSKLSISIEERNPIAWIGTSSKRIKSITLGGYLIDKELRIFPCNKLSPALLNLPLIIVTNADSLEGLEHEIVKNEATLQILKDSILLTKFQNLAFHDMKQYIDKIDIRKPYALFVYFESGLKVAFSPPTKNNTFSGQIEDLKVIIEKFKRRNKKILSVNFLIEENIPVIYSRVALPN